MSHSSFPFYSRRKTELVKMHIKSEMNPAKSTHLCDHDDWITSESAYSVRKPLKSILEALQPNMLEDLIWIIPKQKLLILFFSNLNAYNTNNFTRDHIINIKDGNLTQNREKRKLWDRFFFPLTIKQNKSHTERFDGPLHPFLIKCTTWETLCRN